MADRPIASGCFVWTMFPFGPPDPPDQPGPVRHIAYVLATNSRPKVPMLLLAYTSSGPWRGATGRLPLGVMEFEAAAARTAGQKPFHLDLRCLAQVPLTKRWFPDLERPGRGIVGTANARLTGPEATIDALMSVTAYFRIPRERTREILAEVDGAVATWREEGRAIDMKADELEAFTDAFEHDERRAAQTVVRGDLQDRHAVGAALCYSAVLDLVC